MFRQENKEIDMKKLMKICGIILLIVIIAFGGLLIKNAIASNKPVLSNDYYTWLTYENELEAKYALPGTYDMEHSDVRSKNKSIGKIRVYYPSDINEDGKKYPMVLIVNGSGTPAKIYLPFFERLASWGFIVVGNDDPQTGTGQTTSDTLDYMLKESTVKDHIDAEKIGIAGYSQGGAGALAAVTMYENGSLYKAIFTGSAAYPFLAENMGWKYDYAKIAVPYFMTAATGTSDDQGVEDIEKDFGGVAPLKSLEQIYEGMSDEVFKIRARVAGAEHTEMLNKTDSYMTAWFLYQLQDDGTAEKVFVGEDAEILHNGNWTDIEKNQ